MNKGYPILKHDNAVLREKGLDAWSKLQDERQVRGFTYAETKIWIKYGSLKMYKSVGFEIIKEKEEEFLMVLKLNRWNKSN